ncbi:MAG: hypothetical protein EAZ13_01115 [Sphingobacteriia bacterium]|nr:MAG: hypothetical protein EAZ35_00560 [Sphingobacteriia bacterium]TAH09372.1 MAG: hypothetical protein EAZ13_01115 [Sphingobacteriia bacterium]
MIKGVRKPMYTQPTLFADIEPQQTQYAMLINDIYLNGRVYINDNGTYKEQINRTYYEVTTPSVIDQISRIWRQQNGV